MVFTKRADPAHLREAPGMGSGLGHTTAPFARIEQRLKEGLAAGARGRPGAAPPAAGRLGP